MTEQNVSSERPNLRRLMGAAACAATLYIAMFAIESSDGRFWFAMVLFPISVGIALQTVLDPMLDMPFGDVVKWVFYVLGAFAVALLFLAVETIVCLVIGSPFLVGLPIIGIWIARLLLGRLSTRDPNTVRVSVLGIPALMALPFWSMPVSERIETVSDTVVISAPAHVVWSALMTFETVQSDEVLWTISHNLLDAPMPIRSYVAGDVRHAFWTKSVAYQEHLTTINTNHHMAWDIYFPADFKMDGRDTHISPKSDQLELLRGWYDLSETNGETALTVTTQYRLQTAFNGYVSMWGTRFLSDNHNSILHVLKLRAERARAAIQTETDNG